MKVGLKHYLNLHESILCNTFTAKKWISAHESQIIFNNNNNLQLQT